MCQIWLQLTINTYPFQWHRACYGCLLCGSRELAAGPTIEDVYRDDDGAEGEGGETEASREEEGGEAEGEKEGEEGEAQLPPGQEEAGKPKRADEDESRRRGPLRQQKAGQEEPGQKTRWEEDEGSEEEIDVPPLAWVRGKAGRKEILEAPLCATCILENEIEGCRENRDIVRKALGRIDRYDSGLSRQRWERMHPFSSSEMMPYPRVIANRPHPRTRSHSKAFNQGDGPQPGSHSQQSGLGVPPPDSNPNNIYVSLRNPLDEPSFKPSPAKPIPRWMQLLREGHQLPNEQELQQERAPSPPYPHFHPHPHPIPYLHPRPHFDPLPQNSPEPRARSYLGQPCHIPERASSKSSQLTSEQPRTVIHATSMPILSEAVDTDSESEGFQPTDDPEPLAPPLVTTGSTRSKRDALPMSIYSPCAILAASRCPPRNCNTTGKGKAPIWNPPHESKHVS